MKFARIIIPIMLLIGALTGCKGDEPPPAPPVPSGSLSVEQAVAACGDGCKVVSLDVNVFDEDSNDILHEVGRKAQIVVTAYAAGSDGTPIPVEVIDFRRGVYTQSPYTYSDIIPVLDIQVASPKIIQLAYEVGTVLLPGWSMNCALWEGLVNPIPVSQDDTKNRTDEPIPGTCFVSWPAVTIP